MTDVFNTTLQSWHDFYFMIGGAAAGLVGLMFIALSLGMNVIASPSQEDAKVFVTPSVFYFVSIILIACLILVPTFTPILFEIILLAGGVIGLIITIQQVRKLYRIAKINQDFLLSDWLGQVIFPPSTYALIVLSAILFIANQWELAFMGLWLATVLLLIAAITNTWSLVVWILERRTP